MHRALPYVLSVFNILTEYPLSGARSGVDLSHVINSTFIGFRQTLENLDVSMPTKRLRPGQ